MKTAKLENMTKGWFIGNFEPSLFKTNDVEVAVKSYKKGDYEAKHYHKIATEYTCIISGRVKMNGIEYGAGDIIVMEPNEATDFECLEDGTTNVVVKYPGANNDKYEEVNQDETFNPEIELDHGCAICKYWQGKREFTRYGTALVEGDGTHTYGKCDKKHCTQQQATGFCNSYTSIK